MRPQLVHAGAVLTLVVMTMNSSTERVACKHPPLRRALAAGRVITGYTLTPSPAHPPPHLQALLRPHKPRQQRCCHRNAERMSPSTGPGLAHLSCILCAKVCIADATRAPVVGQQSSEDSCAPELEDGATAPASTNDHCHSSSRMCSAAVCPCTSGRPKRHAWATYKQIRA
ncbi:hypothetical protein B0H11DRAFT_2243024 [Mycena galericulata]|nr:hypothetical protein B0H11DRAFT_2243024 [Mycena galericulata]